MTESQGGIQSRENSQKQVLSYIIPVSECELPLSVRQALENNLMLAIKSVKETYLPLT